MKVTIYSDGSARGNPNGPGGFGTILHYRDPKGELHEKEISAGYKKTTNNRMELMGVIAGMEALNRPCDVEVITDSQYIVNAFEKGWLKDWVSRGYRRKSGELLNVDLWKRLNEAVKPHNIKFTWVKGHAGHPMNERCDKLAVAAALGDALLEDNGIVV